MNKWVRFRPAINTKSARVYLDTPQGIMFLGNCLGFGDASRFETHYEGMSLYSDVGNAIFNYIEHCNSKEKYGYVRLDIEI